MKRNRILTLAILALLASSASLYGQPTFVYTNDDSPINTVSAFRAAANGALTEIAGSPFVTGGSGIGPGFFASNRVTVGVVGRFLFAGNTLSSDVSVFTINPTTGSLALVSGSPFSTGGVGGFGISLAVSPNQRFLYAANGGSDNISVFSIAPSGALTAVGSPVFAQGTPDGVKVSPNGRFLSVALPLALSGAGAVAMFRIAPNGTLTPVPGSPFPDGGLDGTATGVDINCASRFVFAPESNASSTIVDVFRIATNGALTPIPGSPFQFFDAANSNVAVLSPNDRFLFVSNQDSNTVTALRVASNGSLTQVPGSPFSDGSFGLPAGMATNRAGTRLYVANLDNTVTGFSIAGNGALNAVPGSPFATGELGSLLSLAVYPAKACATGDHDDDDCDDDGDRDDHDNDDDNDGHDDDADSDDDNDGEDDDRDFDDDNDGIEDDFDSKGHREIRTAAAGELAAGQEQWYDLANDGTALVLMATAEAVPAQLTGQPLKVEIFDPRGVLVAFSPPTPGRAVATTVPLLAGTYRVKVRNGGLSTVRYNQLRIVRQLWLP